MLIQFSVENYKSIKEEVIINFSSVNNQAENAIMKQGHTLPIYHAIGLVGPNASGKSNILSAIFFALKFIVRTIDRKESDEIGVIPFKLCKDWSHRDTSFEFIFIENEVKYVYGFSVNNKIVTKEYLLVYNSKKPTTLFERDTDREDVFDFKGKNIRVQKEIVAKTNANRLYMAVAAEWGLESCKIPYSWFVKMSRQYMNMRIPEVISNVIKNEKTKAEMISILERADFNIKDINVKVRKIDEKTFEVVNKMMDMISPDDGRISEMIDEIPEIWIKHECADGESFEIEQEEDSAGTKDVINNLAEFIYLKQLGGLFIEDEFGRNYHTKLTSYILELINKSVGSDVQMLFCTHETSIFHVLSPEQIYLVDKAEDGSTFVKLLDDYVIREKDNIELGYLKGRYGAIPYIN